MKWITELSSPKELTHCERGKLKLARIPYVDPKNITTKKSASIHQNHFKAAVVTRQTGFNSSFP